MWIHTETWVHGKEDYFLEKYKDDFFYKQLYDQQDVRMGGRNLTKDDIRKGLVRSKTSKSIPYGEHWTGYYKNEEGHLDTELVTTYTPKLIELLKLFGLYGKGRI